jgi:hypothetical protein
LKTSLLNNKPNEPTPDGFRLPSWWPDATDRGRRNQLWWITVTTFISAVILLASGQWFWGPFLLAVGIFLLVANRRLRAAERLLDEAERQLRLEEPPASDGDPDDEMKR